MKKITIISLFFIYALATMGFSLKEFYCCGKLKSVSFSITGESSAKCKNGDTKTAGCCNNQFHYFKVKDNHVSSLQVALPAQFVVILDTFFPSFQNIVSSISEAKLTYQSHAPPSYNGVPVYLSNCVFRIWFYPPKCVTSCLHISNLSCQLKPLHFYFISH